MKEEREGIGALYTEKRREEGSEAVLSLTVSEGEVASGRVSLLSAVEG